MVDTVSSGGNGPAFATALSGGRVAAMNYGDGTGRVVQTTQDGLHFVNTSETITFPVPASGASHPHMALEYENEILVPDLVCFHPVIELIQRDSLLLRAPTRSTVL